MATYKYFGQFHDYSYQPYDRDQLPGFQSVREVEHYLESCYDGFACYQNFRENEDGHHVPWSYERSATPAATRDGYVMVYGATKMNDGQYLVHQDPEFKLSFGPRGGIIRDNF